MPTLKEVFSPKSYLWAAPQGESAIFNAVVSDYSGLAHESQQLPTVYKISGSSEHLSWQVIVPDLQTGWRYQTYDPEILSHLSEDPTLSPAQKILHLVSNPQNYTENQLLYYWCSPKEPETFSEYTETRTEIGIINRDPQTGAIDGQIISNFSPHWTQSDCLSWHQQFTQSRDCLSPGEIRNSPLILIPDPDQDAVTWFANQIGQPELANQFYSGKLEQDQKATLEKICHESHMFALAVMELFTKGKTSYDSSGIYAAVSQAAGGSLSSTCIYDGTSASSSEGKFVHNCGACGHEIKKVIAKGYHCPKCNGVYQGC